MATTYTLISSQIMAGNTSTVTFSSIPQTYTDLVLKISGNDYATGTDGFYIRFNSDSTADNSSTFLYGNGSTASSAGNYSSSYMQMMYALQATNNTIFGNAELYIPNYTSAINHPASLFGITENTSSTAYIGLNSGLWRSASAINRIDISPSSGGGFIANSSFYLYGIKNS